MCDIIKSIEGRYRKVDDTNSDSGIIVDGEEFIILNEKECDEKLNRTKLKFIEQLIKRRDKLPGNIIREIVEALFKGLNNQ